MLLGELLLQSGYVAEHHIKEALAQKSQKEKIGQVFKRMGLLSDTQLNSLLSYQSNPIKIGELLVTSGDISREQLNDALSSQTLDKKLGEVLVDKGYVNKEKIVHTLSIQKTLVAIALATLLTTSLSEAQTVQLAWDPNSEQDLAGYSVYYAPIGSSLAGGTKVDANVSALPSTTIANLDQYKGWQFAVTAYNTTGQESTFSNIVTVDATPLPTDTTLPTVAITSPATGIKVKGTVTINVNASDNIGIAKVELYDGSTLLFVSNTGPYSFNWNTTLASEGTHSITAKVYDLSNNMSQTYILITVYNVPILPTEIAGIKLIKE